MGGIKNGALLALAEKEFDVFITGDRNLSFQQAVGKFDIAIVVLPLAQYATASHPAIDGEGAGCASDNQTRRSRERVSLRGYFTRTSGETRVLGLWRLDRGGAGEQRAGGVFWFLPF